MSEMSKSYNSKSFHDYPSSRETFLFAIAKKHLLLLIFAVLNLSDSRDFQKIAKLKTRKIKFSRKLNTRNLIRAI